MTMEAGAETGSRTKSLGREVVKEIRSKVVGKIVIRTLNLPRVRPRNNVGESDFKE